MMIRSADRPAAGVRDVEPHLDHLVYATPDLDASIAAFRELTGIEPAAGGSHPGLGTRNVLVALGARCYLEIIGPDLEHPPGAGAAMPFGIGGLAAPRLVTWAVRSSDVRAMAATCAAAGVDIGPVRQMRRVRPDGMLLAWQLALPPQLPLGGLVPFPIDWGSGPHPTDGDLPRAKLLTLRGAHPEPESVHAVLDAIGVRLDVEHSPRPWLRAVIDTPAGPVELG